MDASGAHVTIVGGALTFYAFAHYADSVATPAGWKPRACVQGVPNGAHIALNGLVTVPDGTTYLLLPCSAGAYSVTLTKQFDYSDGSSRTDSVSLSSGTFTWKRDTLTIEDSQFGDGVTASLAGATITVMAADGDPRAWRAAPAVPYQLSAVKPTPGNSYRERGHAALADRV